LIGSHLETVLLDDLGNHLPEELHHLVVRDGVGFVGTKISAS